MLSHVRAPAIARGTSRCSEASASAILSPRRCRTCTTSARAQWTTPLRILVRPPALGSAAARRGADSADPFPSMHRQCRPIDQVTRLQYQDPPQTSPQPWSQLDETAAPPWPAENIKLRSQLRTPWLLVASCTDSCSNRVDSLEFSASAMLSKTTSFTAASNRLQSCSGVMVCLACTVASTAFCMASSSLH